MMHLCTLYLPSTEEFPEKKPLEPPLLIKFTALNRFQHYQSHPFCPGFVRARFSGSAVRHRLLDAA